jgi:hypothetical protein
MKRPPLLLQVRVGGHGRGIPLWLPLFLLLPVAFLLLVGLSPLILVAATILRALRRKLPPVVGSSCAVLCSPRSIGAAVDVLCSTPGLRIDISNRDKNIRVSVI